jgi:cytidylate kinase
MAIVAITEQLGSCARELARLTASRLGYGVMDREEMIRIGAERYHVKPEQLVIADERQPHFWQSKSESRRLITFFRAVLLSEMAQDRMVILGRAVAHLLPEPSCGLRVHVIGPFERRVQRVAEAEKLTPSAAERRVRDFDREVRARVQSVAGVDIDDSSLYDLVLNGSMLATEVLAETLGASVHAVDKLATPQGWGRMRDAALSAQVLADLLAHPKLASAQIEVRCVAGAVEVAGPGLVAPWDDLVREVARRTEGVGEVTVVAEEPAMAYRGE